MSASRIMRHTPTKPILGRSRGRPSKATPVTRLIVRPTAEADITLCATRKTQS
jgi:hypothetical protein